jgi:tellurite resistance protein TerC
VHFPLWAWVVFSVVLLALLAVDLFVHRGHRADSRRSAVVWTVIWIATGLGFGGFVWCMWGSQAALDYVAAYLIEKSLSLDNLFVFLLIFGSLRVPENVQRTALSWGVFGALVFRALFVGVGVVALSRFAWVSYVFGGILLIAAWRAAREDPLCHTGESRLVGWLSRHLPVTPRYHDTRFFVRENGIFVVTPLLLAVIALELTDIMFAIDSVPAAFSVTRDPFLVYSSNAFAILGLRALYIVLAKTIAHLRYLHYGLAAVLAFAGLKMLLEEWVHIPALASIAIIFACIGIAVWVSVRADTSCEEDQGPDAAGLARAR